MASNKDRIEERISMPDGSVVKCYIYPDGSRLMDINDVMKALANPLNKTKLQDLVAEHAQSTYTPPKESPQKPERELSDFNQKLKQGLNWNPKKK